ncbi:hypothetical protein RRG08_034132 [Elysia crispata]|uniref:Uncharacterized protein n=1 Tax=Elysia crispata TaxID=231223 RepID=A0AAE0ZLR9_9GAST|nr:hypothetical protein RRG08_034132 [Elysia crispata]
MGEDITSLVIDGTPQRACAANSKVARASEALPPLVAGGDSNHHQLVQAPSDCPNLTNLRGSSMFESLTLDQPDLSLERSSWPEDWRRDAISRLIRCPGDPATSLISPDR